MSAEPRLRVGSVVVRVPCRAQNDVDRNSRLEALLPKSKALQLVQAVLLRRAVDNCVPEEIVADAGVVHDGFTGSAATCAVVLGALEMPGVSALVVQQAGVVVALVQKLEDAGQGLWLPSKVSTVKPNHM